MRRQVRQIGRLVHVLEEGNVFFIEWEFLEQALGDGFANEILHRVATLNELAGGKSTDLLRIDGGQRFEEISATGDDSALRRATG